MNDITKKVLGGISIAILAGVAGAGIANTMIEPETVIQTMIQEKLVEVPVETLIEVPFETIVEVPVEVDNMNLELVLNHIYDNDGNIEYLTDDLDDDEIGLIVDRIVFINDIKSLAVVEVENEFADLMDKEEFTFGNETVRFDEDDIERVRVKSDGDDLIIDSVDFEDLDADVLVEVKFEQDDVRYLAVCNVEFKDGVVDDIDLESVELRD
jgi:hypothetical protein